MKTVDNFLEWIESAEPGDTYTYFAGRTPEKVTPVFDAALKAYSDGKVELFQRKIGQQGKAFVFAYEAHRISKKVAKKLDEQNLAIFGRAQMHDINTIYKN
jgi:hypothetical protein